MPTRDTVDLSPDQVRTLLTMAAEPFIARVTVGSSATVTRDLIGHILHRLDGIGVDLSATLTVDDPEEPDA